MMVDVLSITSFIASWENSPCPKLLLLELQKKMSTYPEPSTPAWFWTKQLLLILPTNSLTSCGGAGARERSWHLLGSERSYTIPLLAETSGAKAGTAASCRCWTGDWPHGSEAVLSRWCWHPQPIWKPASALAVQVHSQVDRTVTVMHIYARVTHALRSDDSLPPWVKCVLLSGCFYWWSRISCTLVRLTWLPVLVTKVMQAWKFIQYQHGLWTWHKPGHMGFRLTLIWPANAVWRTGKRTLLEMGKIGHCEATVGWIHSISFLFPSVCLNLALERKVFKLHIFFPCSVTWMKISQCCFRPRFQVFPPSELYKLIELGA